MSNRNGVWSLPAQYQAIADQDWTIAPGAPTGVSATAGNAQAEVSFTAPTFAGIPGTITQFKVTSSSGQTATGSASPITVTGLTNGSGVTFTAQAQNAIGLGKASDASSSVTPLAEVISGLFSTHLYTGTQSAATINNGINLSGKGGLVWIKDRSTNGHFLFDTERGATKRLRSHATDAENTDSTSLTAFNTNGFSVGANASMNGSGDSVVSWTFREEPKFFDVVTYTGDGNDGRTISHSLGSTPGMIIVARRDSTNYWRVWHRSQTGKYANLYATGAFASDSASNGVFNNYSGNSSTFTAGININASSATYVAYLFATADGVSKVGSYTGDGTSPKTIDCGFSSGARFVLLRKVSGGDSWYLFDTMQGIADGSADGFFMLDNQSAQTRNQNLIEPHSSGFKAKLWANGSGDQWIFYAIA